MATTLVLTRAGSYPEFDDRHSSFAFDERQTSAASASAINERQTSKVSHRAELVDERRAVLAPDTQLRPLVLPVTPEPAQTRGARARETDCVDAVYGFLGKLCSRVCWPCSSSQLTSESRPVDPPNPPRRWYRIHPELDGERYFVRPDAGLRGRIPGVPRPSRMGTGDVAVHGVESNLKKQLKRSRSLPIALIRNVGLLEPEGLQVDTFRNVCRICYTAPVEVILLPCRHTIFCEHCLWRTGFSRAARMSGLSCPVCRTRIREVVWIDGDAAIPQYGYTIKCH